MKYKLYDKDTNKLVYQTNTFQIIMNWFSLLDYKDDCYLKIAKDDEKYEYIEALHLKNQLNKHE